MQASLTHSINDELFALSFACVLDAPTLAITGLRATDFVAGEIGSIGAASLIGFSRSKFPLSAHAARARASDKANSHFILSPVVQSQRVFCRNKLSMQAVKEMDLREGLLIS